MKIGPYTLANNIALAPMAGVTDLPFRKICRRLGAGYVVGEMLASDPSLRGSKKSRLRGVHLEEPLPRAIQIVGWDPKVMLDAARYNVDQGASIIDINMGCPAKKVCNKYAGSALLADENLVARILGTVVAGVDVPVTLKIRTGVSPVARNGVTIAQIAERAGVAALAVHGRTRACKYNGIAEFETIKQICKAVSIPVFANGDIAHYADAKRVLFDTGAAGLMIGRGAHGAPWFPGMVANYLESGKEPSPPSLVVQKEIVLEHLEKMYAFYGASKGVRIARKHIKWYLSYHSEIGHGHQSMQQDCIRADLPQIQRTLVAELYDRLINHEQKAQVWYPQITKNFPTAPQANPSIANSLVV